MEFLVIEIPPAHSNYGMMLTGSAFHRCGLVRIRVHIVLIHPVSTTDTSCKPTVIVRSINISRELKYRMKSFCPIAGFSDAEISGLTSGGNSVFNGKFLARLTADEKRQIIEMRDDKMAMRNHIRRKYVDKVWYSSCGIENQDFALLSQGQPNNSPIRSTEGESLTLTTRSQNSPCISRNQTVEISVPSVAAQILPSGHEDHQPIATAYAFAVGRDLTSRRAVRVSRAYAERMNLPETCAVIIPAEEPVLDVGPIEVVGKNPSAMLGKSTMNTSLIADCSSIVEDSSGDDFPLLDLSFDNA